MDSFLCRYAEATTKPELGLGLRRTVTVICNARVSQVTSVLKPCLCLVRSY